jgi:hypothetical protein
MKQRMETGNGDVDVIIITRTPSIIKVRARFRVQLKKGLFLAAKKSDQ